jgi:hypothetical protein
VNWSYAGSGVTDGNGEFTRNIGPTPFWGAVLDSHCVNPDPDTYWQEADDLTPEIEWQIEDFEE